MLSLVANDPTLAVVHGVSMAAGRLAGQAVDEASADLADDVETAAWRATLRRLRWLSGGLWVQYSCEYAPGHAPVLADGWRAVA